VGSFSYHNAADAGGKGRPGDWQQKAENWSQIAKFWSQIAKFFAGHPVILYATNKRLTFYLACVTGQNTLERKFLSDSSLSQAR
jgi:hypothetical protein